MFCDLVELQNFTRTAEKHGISQSAVSQQLAQLEIAYKCQLINRKKRPLTLTSAGEVFYAACKDIFERYERLNSELINLTRPATRINLAAIFSIGMHTLQPYVKKFMAKYPKVNLHVKYYSSTEIYDNLLKGTVDIGIVAVPKRDRNIDVYPFLEEPLVLVCSVDNPLAQTTSSIDIHTLASQPFIAFEENVPSRMLIDNILNLYNVKVRTVMAFDNTETIKRAVEIDAGISILPEPTIHTEFANGSLHAIQFSNETFTRPTGIIVRKDKIFSRPGRYLIELLRKRDT